MSSRALRKLQKAQEKVESSDQIEEDESSGNEARQPSRLNAFDMLTKATNGDTEIESVLSDFDDKDAESKQDDSMFTSATPSKKKKKNRKKKDKINIFADGRAENVGETKKPTRRAAEMDEIDLALKSLSTTHGSYAISNVKEDEDNVELYRLLSIEPKNLNALNEMKRLFGNVVLEGDNERLETGPTRNRRSGQVELTIDEALSARNSPLSEGRGLTGLALRRNVFMLGKEEWPRAASGGLGMEVVEKSHHGTIQYRFLHNPFYQNVQAQFSSCAASMDPQRMINLLQYNRTSQSKLSLTQLTLSQHIIYQLCYRSRKSSSIAVIIQFLRTYSNGPFSTSVVRCTRHSAWRSPKERRDWISDVPRTENSGSRHGNISPV